MPPSPETIAASGDFPKISLVATWIRADHREQQEKQEAADGSPELGLSDRLAVAVERDAVKLDAMVDEAEAELLGDALLKKLQFLIHELDDRSPSRRRLDGRGARLDAASYRERPSPNSWRSRMPASSNRRTVR